MSSSGPIDTKLPFRVTFRLLFDFQSSMIFSQIPEGTDYARCTRLLLMWLRIVVFVDVSALLHCKGSVGSQKL